MAFGNFFAPAVVNKSEDYGLSMSLGGCTYVTFILSLVYINEAAVYFFSALIGVGASILWTAQGAFLTACSTPSNRGKLVGIFLALLSVGNVLGNIAASLLLSLLPPAPKSTTIVTEFNGANSYLFLGLGIVSSCGILVLTTLRGEKKAGGKQHSAAVVASSLASSLPHENDKIGEMNAFLDPAEDGANNTTAPTALTQERSTADKEGRKSTETTSPCNDTSKEEECNNLISGHSSNMPEEEVQVISSTEAHTKKAAKSTAEFVMQTFRLLFSPKMLCLAPLFYFSGNSSSFYGSQFTRQIDDSTNVGYAMAVLSCAGIVGSLGGGYLVDKFGRSRTLILYTIIQIVAHFLVWFANRYQGGYIYAAALSLGLADSCLQTVLFPLLATEFGEASEFAFAVKAFLGSMGAAVAFMYLPLLASPGQKSTDRQLLVEIVINSVLLGVAITGYFISLRVTYRDSTKRKLSDQEGPVN